MKVTTKDIVGGMDSLVEIMSMPWPGKMTMRLAQVHRKIKGTFEDYEETRLKLIKEHGKVEGEGYKLEPDKRDLVTAELKKAGEVVVELTGVRKFSESDLQRNDLKCPECDTKVREEEPVLAIHVSNLHWLIDIKA